MFFTLMRIWRRKPARVLWFPQSFFYLQFVSFLLLWPPFGPQDKASMTNSSMTKTSMTTPKNDNTSMTSSSITTPKYDHGSITKTSMTTPKYDKASMTKGISFKWARCATIAAPVQWALECLKWHSWAPGIRDHCSEASHDAGMQG